MPRNTYNIDNYSPYAVFTHRLGAALQVHVLSSATTFKNSCPQILRTIMVVLEEALPPLPDRAFARCISEFLQMTSGLVISKGSRRNQQPIIWDRPASTLQSSPNTSKMASTWQHAGALPLSMRPSVHVSI